MELVFMAEAALALRDLEALDRLMPFLTEYEGMNLVCGTLIATFGSADRYLARIAALHGDDARAEHLFGTALAMDRTMRSTVHTAETLAHHAVFLAERGAAERAGAVADQARAMAEAIGQARVLAALEPVARPRTGTGPDRLTDREVDVLRLLADGLSNSEIGARLHISANTAANHVRSILQKTGAANRTQAAMYAANHHLL